MKKQILLALVSLMTITSCTREDEMADNAFQAENSMAKVESGPVLANKGNTMLAYSASINRIDFNDKLSVDFYNIIGTKETVELVMQSNEDLVCYYTDFFGMRKTIWASGSHRPAGFAVPCHLTFQDDGDFAIYENHSNTPIWRLNSHWTGPKTQYRDFRLEVWKEGSRVFAYLHLYRSGTWYKTVFKQELIVH